MKTRKYLEYANIIHSESSSTYGKYIQVSRLCMDKEVLIPLVEELNMRELLKENKTTSFISLLHLGVLQLTLLQP